MGIHQYIEKIEDIFSKNKDLEIETDKEKLKINDVNISKSLNDFYETRNYINKRLIEPSDPFYRCNNISQKTLKNCLSNSHHNIQQYNPITGGGYMHIFNLFNRDDVVDVIKKYEKIKQSDIIIESLEAVTSYCYQEQIGENEKQKSSMCFFFMYKLFEDDKTFALIKRPGNDSNYIIKTIHDKFNEVSLKFNKDDSCPKEYNYLKKDFNEKLYDFVSDDYWGLKRVIRELSRNNKKSILNHIFEKINLF